MMPACAHCQQTDDGVKRVRIRELKSNQHFDAWLHPECEAFYLAELDTKDVQATELAGGPAPPHAARRA